MNSNRTKLIEHFISKCSMAIQEATRIADMNDNLYQELQCSNVRFCFKKKDGTIREALGTMQKSVIPEIKGTGRPLNFDLQLYYDLDCKSFRSFKKANLISYFKAI